jgi:hypothetical protein
METKTREPSFRETSWASGTERLEERRLEYERC